MSGPGSNPLSYNAYISQVAAMAVYQTQETAGVVSFLDAPPTLITPMILNYAELRIQRDMDLLSSQSSNTYTLTPMVNVFPLPVDDFLIVNTVEITQASGSTVVNATPLLPVSKEFIQNVYGGVSSAGTPQYFAMYGDQFGGTGDTFTNILLGPPPSYGFSLRVTGTQRLPSLYKYAATGVADTQYTYISAYLPDLLVMASLIYISAFQRNFGPTSDTPESGMTYEKQYQALRIGAIQEENRRKQLGSGYSSYSTPVSATPTR
jgi:hypothetical protein